MRILTQPLIGLALLASATTAALPAAGASFVYRGALTDRGAPAEGDYGFRLTFYDAQSGGTALAPATTLDGVSVSRGAFSASVELDPALQSRGTLWVQVDVRDSTGVFVPMADREALQPKAVTAGICWDTTGNAGTNPSTNFVGNTDNQALNLRIDNLPVAQFGVLNLAGSPFANSIVMGAVNDGNFIGATISGGGEGTTTCGISGSDSCGNSVTTSFGTVAGGRGNIAGDSAAVGGGASNIATGQFSMAPGGNNNRALAQNSFAAGHRGVVRAGDSGSFVWADNENADFSTTNPNQFMVRAKGGIGLAAKGALGQSPFAAGNPAIGDVAIRADNGLFINAPSTGQGAQLTLSDTGSANPGTILRMYASTADAATGSRIRMTENSLADSGGYIHYDAASNTLAVGTNNGAGDSDVLVMPRSGIGLGINRVPVTYQLEVAGEAGKTVGGTTWQVVSDARIKTAVEPIGGALDRIVRLNPVRFRYTDAYLAHVGAKSVPEQYGVVAQEYREVFPEAVRASNEYLPGAEHRDANRILNVDLHPAFVTGLAAIQELAVADQARDERIASLSRENAALRARLDALSARLDALSSRAER